MSLFDRWLSPRSSQQEADRDKALRELAESSKKLRDKLDEDPCASDPTRESCAKDPADVLIAVRMRREMSR